MINLFRKPIILISLCLTSLLVGCASTAKDPIDPFEAYNRKMYAFNGVVDTIAIEPAIKAYTMIIPWPLRQGVDNFFINLYQLPTIANDILQGEIKLTFKDIGRFLINTTLGIGGLFDVATGFGLERNYQDFGITLSKWGDTSSPYLILPLLGPSTVRDTFGLGIDYRVFSVYAFIQPLSLNYSVLGVEAFAERASYQELTELAQLIAIDPYVLQRDAYLQRRKYLINGGQLADGLYIEDAGTQGSQPDSQNLYVDGSNHGNSYVDEPEDESTDMPTDENSNIRLLA